MKTWQCNFCSHIYDEAAGDPANGIAAGTRLADPPEDWTGPACGAGTGDYRLPE